MVSRKQHALNMRTVFCLAAIAAVAALAPAIAAENSGKKFYSDDPLRKEPSPRPVSQVATRQVDDLYDFLENSYVTPKRERKAMKRAAQPALDVNTLGEVPDNAWYTNRHAFHRMSIEELQRGPGNTTPPSPDGAWRIVGAKSDGVTPGFVIEDGNKNRYLLKFDPPDYPELCSAADVIGSKFFYALGYFTPENYVVHFRLEDLAIPAGATWRDSTGRKHPLTMQTISELLKPQPKDSGGKYRAVASRWVEGQAVGPFNYNGTRSDDPNDTIAHEDRRVLRGLRVFASWLNHQDTRSINSMDTLVTADGRQFLKHYLIDFGSILGSAGYARKEPWMGHQYAIARPEAAVQMVTFGFYLPVWVRSSYPRLTGVGLFNARSFDPLKWKGSYPNPAFLKMDLADAFWAAKQVAAFTDAEIRAIVQTGEFSDPRAADWIIDCLIQRRDKIAEAWFGKVLPLDNFHVAEGKLAFDDLSEYAAGMQLGYEISWASFDNSQGVATKIPGAVGRKLPATEGSIEYLAATIADASGADTNCPNPVTVYLRRSANGFQVVGIDR
jgi:hypothetical protein